METQNKVQRQEAWLRTKRDNGRTQIQGRKTRRRGEDKNPQLRAERLARYKPKTLEDKRIWPVSEDDYARRKRRKVAEEAQVLEEKMEEDNEEEGSTEEAAAEAEGNSDDDLASFLGDDDEEEEEAASRKKKGAKEETDSMTADEKAARQDAMAEKYAELLKEPAPAEPRILITTSRHATIHKYAHTLVDLFPNSTYIPRSGHRFVHHEYSIREIAGYATNRGYTALLILNEDLKKATGLDIALLPHGPMLHFSIQTWVDAKFLPNHGRSTGHSPEMIMNNFDTSLGKLVGGVLGRLFPPNPDLIGRQVVTLHNQRDYVFVRRHRYAVRDKRATERSVADKNGRPMAGVEDVKVALQEIGPRMTLKLRRVDQGLQRRSGQVFEWRGRMEKQRTLWQL